MSQNAGAKMATGMFQTVCISGRPQLPTAFAYCYGLLLKTMSRAEIKKMSSAIAFCSCHGHCLLPLLLVQ